jgi:hypothetical protein
MKHVLKNQSTINHRKPNRLPLRDVVRLLEIREKYNPDLAQLSLQEGKMSYLLNERYEMRVSKEDMEYVNKQFERAKKSALEVRAMLNTLSKKAKLNQQSLEAVPENEAGVESFLEPLKDAKTEEDAVEAVTKAMLNNSETAASIFGIDPTKIDSSDAELNAALKMILSENTTEAFFRRKLKLNDLLFEDSDPNVHMLFESLQSVLLESYNENASMELLEKEVVPEIEKNFNVLQLGKVFLILGKSEIRKEFLNGILARTQQKLRDYKYDQLKLDSNLSLYPNRNPISKAGLANFLKKEYPEITNSLESNDEFYFAVMYLQSVQDQADKVSSGLRNVLDQDKSNYLFKNKLKVLFNLDPNKSHDIGLGFKKNGKYKFATFDASDGTPFGVLQVDDEEELKNFNASEIEAKGIKSFVSKAGVVVFHNSSDPNVEEVFENNLAASAKALEKAKFKDFKVASKPKAGASGSEAGASAGAGAGAGASGPGAGADERNVTEEELKKIVGAMEKGEIFDYGSNEILNTIVLKTLKDGTKIGVVELDNFTNNDVPKIKKDKFENLNVSLRNVKISETIRKLALIYKDASEKNIENLELDNLNSTVKFDFVVNEQEQESKKTDGSDAPTDASNPDGTDASGAEATGADAAATSAGAGATAADVGGPGWFEKLAEALGLGDEKKLIESWQQFFKSTGNLGLALAATAKAWWNSKGKRTQALKEAFKGSGLGKALWEFSRDFVKAGYQSFVTSVKGLIGLLAKLTNLGDSERAPKTVEDFVTSVEGVFRKSHDELRSRTQRKTIFSTGGNALSWLKGNSDGQLISKAVGCVLTLDGLPAGIVAAQDDFITRFTKALPDEEKKIVVGGTRSFDVKATKAYGDQIANAVALDKGAIGSIGDWLNGMPAFQALSFAHRKGEAGKISKVLEEVKVDWKALGSDLVSIWASLTPEQLDEAYASISKLVKQKSSGSSKTTMDADELAASRDGGSGKEGSSGSGRGSATGGSEGSASDDGSSSGGSGGSGSSGGGSGGGTTYVSSGGGGGSSRNVSPINTNDVIDSSLNWIQRKAVRKGARSKLKDNLNQAIKDAGLTDKDVFEGAVQRKQLLEARRIEEDSFARMRKLAGLED